MTQISTTADTIQAEATADQPSPTAGMNMAQRIQHVGGRNPPGSTYVEFGSIQAVEALVAQVLRDQKQAEHQIIRAFLERTGQYVTNDATRKAAIADAVAQALSPKRGTDAQILFERELTCAAIDGAMAFGYRGGPAPAGDSQWLLPFYKVGADQARLERTGQSVTNDARPLSVVERHALHALIAVAAATHHALDDSEERLSGAHTLNQASYKEVCETLDALASLPDDRPGYTMAPEAKAEWALRRLTATPPEAATAEAIAQASNEGRQFEAERLSALAATAETAGKAPASVPSEAVGIERAAAWIDQRRQDFMNANGYGDPDTGAFEYGRGAHADAATEYVGELVEIADGLRALLPCTRPPTGWTCTRQRGHDGPCAALAAQPRSTT